MPTQSSPSEPEPEPETPDPADRTVARTRRRALIVISVFGAFAGLLFGYDTGVISGALLYLSVDAGFNPGGLTSFQQGLVTSLMLPGAAVMSLVGGHLADRWGRKVLLQIGGGLFLLGALGSAIAPNYAVICSSRVVLGLGLGVTSTVVPVFLGEIAPKKVRGRVMGTNTVMINVGQMLAISVNAAVGFTHSWRLMLVLAVVPAVLLGIGLFFITDTPNWYMRHGRVKQARDVLLRTREPDEVQETMYELDELAKAESGNRARVADFFKVKWLRRILLVGICVALINQLGGINTIMYFAPILFRTIGFSDQAALNIAIPITAVSMLASMTVGVGIIDHFPRRRLLGIGTAGVAVTMAAMGIAFGFIQEGGPRGPAWVFLGIMAVYLVLNQGFISATTWAVVAEVFPGHLRGQGMGIATFCLWTSNFLISLGFLPALNAIGGRWTFMAFAIINVFAFLFVLFVVPETRGKSLEAIEREARARVKH
ncbi:MAG: sugar porter family MFS transporter [Bifidobacteriaceae bacterium]|jgi:major inositol transporter-like SP family MFS transporter|nr:sugar porter family MFS transporter [Bifidobacteriaceae bacterium]